MADPEVEDENQPAKKDWRKEYETRAKVAEEEAAQLRRELAFTKAGLDGLSDKQVKALVAAHDGDMTADALKATADELGFGAKETGQSPPAPESVPAQVSEAAELARLANSPAEHAATPSQGEAAFVKQIEEFDGDYQAFQQFVMDNADQFGAPSI